MKYRFDNRTHTDDNGEIMGILQQLEFEATALHTAGIGAKGRGKAETYCKLDREYHNTYCGMGSSASHSADHVSNHNGNQNTTYYDNNYSNNKVSRSASRVSFNDEAPLREGRRRSVSASRSRSPSSEHVHGSRPPTPSSSSFASSSTPLNHRSQSPYLNTPHLDQPSSPEDEVQARYLSLLRQMGDGGGQDKGKGTMHSKGIDKGDQGVLNESVEIKIKGSNTNTKLEASLHLSSLKQRQQQQLQTRKESTPGFKSPSPIEIKSAVNPISSRPTLSPTLPPQQQEPRIDATNNFEGRKIRNNYIENSEQKNGTNFNEKNNMSAEGNMESKGIFYSTNISNSNRNSSSGGNSHDIDTTEITAKGSDSSDQCQPSQIPFNDPKDFLLRSRESLEDMDIWMSREDGQWGEEDEASEVGGLTASPAFTDEREKAAAIGPKPAPVPTRPVERVLNVADSMGKNSMRSMKNQVDGFLQDLSLCRRGEVRDIYIFIYVHIYT
jgi:hypothetical protein